MFCCLSLSLSLSQDESNWRNDYPDEEDSDSDDNHHEYRHRAADIGENTALLLNVHIVYVSLIHCIHTYSGFYKCL